MKYTNPENIENYLVTEIENSFEVVINTWIDAISKMMDKYAGRTLVVDTESTRYFDGNGKEEIYIDDVHDISAIQMGDEYGDNLAALTGYSSFPKGGVAINLLKLRSGSFTLGTQNIAITGKFGLFKTTVPEDIKLCATRMVSKLIEKHIPKTTKDIKSETVGAYSVTYKDIEADPDVTEVLSMLQPYVKMSI